MRPLLLLTSLCLFPLLSGCAEDPAPSQDVPASNAPMSGEILDVREATGHCNNLFREQDILVVQVRLTNGAAFEVGPADYDVVGEDGDGEAYPMCWPDEPVVEARRSVETTFRFYVTHDECDVLRHLMVRQLFAGQWVEHRVATGLADPCPGP